MAPNELELLNWLLERGLPEAKSFAHQVERIRASRWCTCGCPSISLHVEENVPTGTCSQSVISDFVGLTPDGKKCGVLLFQKAGKLILLEAYQQDPIDGTWGFPVISSLQRFEDVGQVFVKDPQTGRFIQSNSQFRKDSC